MSFSKQLTSSPFLSLSLTTLLLAHLLVLAVNGPCCEASQWTVRCSGMIHGWVKLLTESYTTAHPLLCDVSADPCLTPCSQESGYLPEELTLTQDGLLSFHLPTNSSSCTPIPVFGGLQMHPSGCLQPGEVCLSHHSMHEVCTSTTVTLQFPFLPYSKTPTTDVINHITPYEGGGAAALSFFLSLLATILVKALSKKVCPHPKFSGWEVKLPTIGRFVLPTHGVCTGQPTLEGIWERGVFTGTMECISSSVSTMSPIIISPEVCALHLPTTGQLYRGTRFWFWGAISRSVSNPTYVNV